MNATATATPPAAAAVTTTQGTSIDDDDDHYYCYCWYALRYAVDLRGSVSAGSGCGQQRPMFAALMFVGAKSVA